jgi:hypothetical protein
MAIKKKKKTFEDLYNEQVGTVGTTVESEKVVADFKALLANEEGQIVIPEKEDEKIEWFMDVVHTAINKGMVKKDIVTNLSRVSIEGKLLGEKLAAGIYEDAKQEVKTEIILARFPNHKLGDDESDIKRAVAAYWSQSETVKIGENEIPVAAAFNHNGAFDAYVTYFKLGKQAHKRELTDTEKADYLAAETLVRESIKLVKLDRPEAVVALKKYLNADQTPSRGRGANKYAGIGSKIDFDCME